MIKLDEEGRFTLPAKIRESLQIHPRDSLVIKVNQDKTLAVYKKPTKMRSLKN